jgi:hypothetical protein
MRASVRASARDHRGAPREELTKVFLGLARHSKNALISLRIWCAKLTITTGPQNDSRRLRQLSTDGQTVDAQYAALIAAGAAKIFAEKTSDAVDYINLPRLMRLPEQQFVTSHRP